ncbi:MAG: VCBS repeat-containing protein [Acidobacteria bacterium]|nr:VCBS repeat-containing protein [Acidobacteriota bacterium]
MHSQTTAAGGADRNQLEIIETLSESLANDLLDLSLAVRNRNTQQIAEFFPAQFFGTPLPTVPLPVQERMKGIGQHGWRVEQEDKGGETATPVARASGQGAQAAAPVRPLSRDEFVPAWSAFLTHFAEIEDARFKVKQAEFDESARAVVGGKEPTAAVGASGRARIAFYVIGRDSSGRREWARGVVRASVRRAENGRWQFSSFELASLDSWVASTALFSEVSVPAGVAVSRPPFGSAENSSYAWQGAAAADFDRDGRIDLFVVTSYRPYLYLNNGAGRFLDASEEAGLGLMENAVAPLALDYDNDGDLDVFISAVGSQILLENQLEPSGKLVFRDVSLTAGVAVQAIGFSAVAGDVNRDGLPDIYVTGYNHYGRVVPNSWFRATNGTPNLLFVNQGNGTFREAAAQWGVDDRRWSYAAAFADVNQDGQQDLYVANDFGENALFINKGDHFSDQAQERGVLDPGYGMGVSFGDYNNDGQLDLHVTNMSSTAGNRILSRLFPAAGPKENVLVKLAAGNNLYENVGDGHYQDVTEKAGPFSGGWAWGGGFLDFDNDGWEDLFTPNGFISGKSMKDT